MSIDARTDPGVRVAVHASQLAAMPDPVVRVEIWHADILAAGLILDAEMAREIAASLIKAADIVEKHSSARSGATQ